MTNREKWNEYTSGLSSPQNYIDWGWLYIISAALQRRVWCGPVNQPLFPNMYVILVGEPGIGKGLVLREVSELLKFWKLEVSTGNQEVATTPEEKAQAEMIVQSDLKHAQDVEFQGKSKGSDIAKPLLIPISADAITYEALVNAVGESYRRINYKEFSPVKGLDVIKVYGHSSVGFVLQELASLMRKRTHDIINYLLGLYDCPLDYEYVTLTRGKDRVRRGCLNLIAGTTPSFMQSTFDENLVDEGFSSRTFYIFANKNRKNQMWIPPLTPEQDQYKIDLLTHIKKLTTLYGNVTMDSETRIFLQEWWNEYENNKHTRANKSLKLKPYYSRKNIHVVKVAMAMHFGESTDLTIPLETFQRAIKFLEREELNMHLALTLEGNNPLSKVTRKILELLHTGKKNFVELMIETHGATNQAGLEEALGFLQLTNQIRATQEEDKTTEQKMTYWSLI